MTQNLNLYEFIMALFNNGDQEELFFKIKNFNINIKASGTLVASVNIQCLSMLVHEEAFHKFYMFSAEVGSTTSENLKSINLGLGTYFCMLTRCKQKSMLRRTKNFCS